MIYIVGIGSGNSSIKALINKYYSPQTKIIFAYKISFSDEQIIETTLEKAEDSIKGMNINKHTIILTQKR